MKVYDVRSTGGRLGSVVVHLLMLAGGAGILNAAVRDLLAALSADSDTRAGNGGEITFLAGAVLFILLWCAQIVWNGLSVHVIRPDRFLLDEGGGIETIGLLGRTTIQPSEIASIERLQSETGDGSPRVRKIRVAHTRGRVTIPYFEGADTVIATLLSRNPGIVLTGSWQERD